MQREVTLIFGQTGSGKTTHAKKILETLPRALVVEADFGEFPALAFDDYDGLLQHLSDKRAFSNFDSRPPRLSSVPFRVSYSPRIAEYDLVFATAYELGNCVLLLDEADRFDDPRSSPDYDELITRGRHYGVGLVACGLHLYKLPKDLRRQATRVIALKQIDPGDIYALSEIVGPAAYQIGPDKNGKFQIPDFAYLDWNPRDGSKIVGGPVRERVVSPTSTGLLPPRNPTENGEPSDEESTDPDPVEKNP